MLWTFVSGVRLGGLFEGSSLQAECADSHLLLGISQLMPKIKFLNQWLDYRREKYAHFVRKPDSATCD